jgi:putative ABC transport system permease protein
VDVHAGTIAATATGGQGATANALDLLDVPPRLGRAFLPGEDLAPNLRHVILGYDIWQDLFGGSEAVLGTTVPDR